MNDYRCVYKLNISNKKLLDRLRSIDGKLFRNLYALLTENDRKNEQTKWLLRSWTFAQRDGMTVSHILQGLSGSHGGKGNHAIARLARTFPSTRDIRRPGDGRGL